METVLSTYRVQLNLDFRLSDLTALVPYLARLGVSHVYLSPILKARSGSGHGYDVVDPQVVNPEIGNESDLERLVAALRCQTMGLVLDIVPNHMATGSENRYWEDVLTHGRSSPFADWFDIDWGPGSARRPYRVFLPVLGDRLARVIARHELKLSYREGDFRFDYYDQSFPLDPMTLPQVLDTVLLELDQRGTTGPERQALAGIIAALGSIPSCTDRRPESVARRREGAKDALDKLEALYRASPDLKLGLDATVDSLSAHGGEKRLRRLLAAQAYRLAYWRRGAREINYRRFFTISHLVGLRTEDADVFEQTHSLLLDWVRQGWVDGIRLDHIDGLLDPLGYLNRLSDAIKDVSAKRDSERIPIYVEKILAREEKLLAEWPVSGTTGYEFLNEVEDVLLDPNGYWELDAAYGRFIRRSRRFNDVARRSKRKILAGHLAAECRRLSQQLERLTSERFGLDRTSLNVAIVETIACLPVYRTYLDARASGPRDADVKTLTRAFNRARSIGRAADRALQVLSHALLPLETEPWPGAEEAERLDFAQRFQQLCVAAAAKGVEDTALYLHVPLASRNEVGGNPGAPFPGARAALHAANLHRAHDWPHTLLCTSTHDTKRSADVRARLDVLSELADLWEFKLRHWHSLNRSHRVLVQGRYAPDRNTECLFYQTLLGLWPSPAELEVGPAAAERLRDIEARITAYMRKAVREAKLQTSWVQPNPEFEAALEAFIGAVFSLERSRRFLTEVEELVQRIDSSGRWNSLTRTLIQLTAPGTPDIYQGDEIWNFSLVDPDNRRPVDYVRRSERLEQILSDWESAQPEERHDFLRRLAEDPADDTAKLWITQRALQARRAFPDLFRQGCYEPLTATGPRSGHLFAFARGHLDRSAITVAALRTQSLPGEASATPIGRVWTGTELRLPAQGGPFGWRCALSGAVFERPVGPHPTFPVDGVLGSLPVALLLPLDDPSAATLDR
jgi:(1->4)-alpha-D-glucan 1-alpha-D-glucosylmutase